jgi:hypothetical protein
MKNKKKNKKNKKESDRHSVRGHIQAAIAYCCAVPEDSSDSPKSPAQ